MTVSDTEALVEEAKASMRRAQLALREARQAREAAYAAGATTMDLSTVYDNLRNEISDRFESR